MQYTVALGKTRSYLDVSLVEPHKEATLVAYQYEVNDSYERRPCTSVHGHDD